MSEERHKLSPILVIAMVVTQVAFAESARTLTRLGNKLYGGGNFNEAINQYDQALADLPGAPEPKLNKANSYYRLDDLDKAMDLYKDVAAEAKDMKLVTKAKYNLGNCYFQEGSKQRDSDLQKALESMKTSILHWRAVLDIEPENEKAARNIEVARLTIKDILDQINKQKQDPNQPQDPNQSQQQQQSQQGQDQKQQSAQRDPNQPQDPNQTQKPNQGRDPNESQDPNESDQQQQQQQQQSQREKEEQSVAPDATAQEILDKEQQQKEQRQILQRGRYQKVERDW